MCTYRYCTYVCPGCWRILVCEFLSRTHVFVLVVCATDEKGVKAMRDAEANRVAATKGKTLASFGIKPQPAGNAPV